MYKLVKFITKIPYKDFSTYYLFCKNNSTLIPIEIYNNDQYSGLSVYDFIRRILKIGGFSIIGIKIYRFLGNTFYTYLTIKKEDMEFDVNISFKDGIELSKEISSPIFIRDKVLELCGIEITKDMVIEALKDSEQIDYLER